MTKRVDVVNVRGKSAKNMSMSCIFSIHFDSYRHLSRRLDHCDRVIQDESGDSNGVLCVIRHNAIYVRYA